MALELEKINEKPIAEIRINSYKNNFDKTEATSFGRVEKPSKRVTVANLVALIADRHVGVEPGMIGFVARLLNEEIMRQLEEGKSVEALGLGTVYVGIRGTMKGQQPSIADVPNFVIKFRPAKTTKMKLKNIKPGSITPIKNVPVINLIEDMKTKKHDSDLKAGTIVRLCGKRLRVEGTNSEVGLYLIKEDNSTVKVDKADIIRNEPSTLEFILPSTVKPGSFYSIVIKNQGKVKDGFSKTLRVGTSQSDVKIVP
ncbi:MAG: DUF4469 domain-containing protein [Treponema sp.]